MLFEAGAVKLVAEVLARHAEVPGLCETAYYTLTGFTTYGALVPAAHPEHLTARRRRYVP
jgi:hypothetical protein